MGDTQSQEETQEQTPEAQEPVEAQEPKPEGEEAPPEEAKADSEEGEPAEAEKPEGQEPPKAEEKHRRAGGWQRKIERLERQNQLLLEQLAAQRPGQPQPAQPEASKDPAVQAQEVVRSLIRQQIEEERQAERQARAQTEFQERYAAVRTEHEDFDEVVASVSHIPVPAAVNEALLTSEHGPKIMYELASNPAELARISALPPIAAAREIGRLEARLSSSTAAPPKPKSVPRPPAPPTSVSGKASSTRSLEDLPISEYKRAFRSGRR